VEQFMKLPPGQKAAVLAAVLAVVGIGLYFLLVDPELARADKNRKDLAKVERDLGDLQKDASPEEQLRLQKLKDDLTELDKENRKMLPGAAEIPDFIDSVQRDARQVGLSVLRFDRLPDESYDLYNTVPIRMVIQGTTRQVMEFMRIYAGPERRVVNIRELSIERVQPDAAKLKEQLKASKPLDDVAKTGNTVKTPDETLLENIELSELARKNSEVRAAFIAYAYTWTGKPAVKDENAQQQQIKKPKKKRT
jgi:Tfp pilus assembly protein PilO